MRRIMSLFLGFHVFCSMALAGPLGDLSDEWIAKTTAEQAFYETSRNARINKSKAEEAYGVIQKQLAEKTAELEALAAQNKERLEAIQNGNFRFTFEITALKKELETIKTKQIALIIERKTLEKKLETEKKNIDTATNEVRVFEQELAKEIRQKAEQVSTLKTFERERLWHSQKLTVAKAEAAIRELGRAQNMLLNELEVLQSGFADREIPLEYQRKPNEVIREFVINHVAAMRVIELAANPELSIEKIASHVVYGTGLLLGLPTALWMIHSSSAFESSKGIIDVFVTLMSFPTYYSYKALLKDNPKSERYAEAATIGIMGGPLTLTSVVPAWAVHSVVKKLGFSERRALKIHAKLLNPYYDAMRNHLRDSGKPGEDTIQVFLREALDRAITTNTMVTDRISAIDCEDTLSIPAQTKKISE